ncbi:MAG TPA: DUF342 domain-containing protein [Lachnospiraceae bacterium]|nr:DUF342 domain-containing protein [Lachnospiraceae bacterium]
MNGYFQIINNDKGTCLRLVPPTEGGEKIDISELSEYLQSKQIEVKDFPSVAKVAGSLDKESLVLLSPTKSYSQQEMFKLIVSPDNMTAIGRFYPPSNDGEKLKGASEIFDDLKFKKVVFGYDESAIAEFLKKRNYCEDIVLAKGLQPVQGHDGYVEYFFNTELSTKPARNEDGSVDFHNLNTINHCKAGDKLATLHPEVRGTEGCTVFGEKIKPKDVKHETLRYGHNISLSEDGLSMISDINGHVALIGDKVFVSDVYEVENVGSATGNVESEGSVLVNGNVQAGYSVKAKGNVEVRGVVEGAQIEAGGDIIIAKGMNGMGKGELKAGGRVILKFAENAKIVAGQYVESDSILHSDVSAGTEVTVNGRKGFISGGTVRAGECISCKTLGSSMGADTIVEVGVDPEVKKRFAVLQKEMVELNKQLTTMEPVINNVMEKLKRGEKFAPDKLNYIKTLVATQKQQSARFEQVKAEINMLEETIKSVGRASVAVSGDVYEGTKITIGDASMVVKNSYKFCRFIKDRGDIKSVAY